MYYVTDSVFQCRVFIEFERQHLAHGNITDVAQPVQEAVYIALKKRHERGRFFLYAKDDRPSQERRRHSIQGAGPREHREGEGSGAVASLGIESAGVVRSIPPANLPDQGTLQIMITEVCAFLDNVQISGRICGSHR